MFPKKKFFLVFSLATKVLEGSIVYIYIINCFRIQDLKQFPLKFKDHENIRLLSLKVNR